jgi:hypothetical protein
MMAAKIADLQRENNELRTAMIAWSMWSEGDSQ